MVMSTRIRRGISICTSIHSSTSSWVWVIELQCGGWGCTGGLCHLVPTHWGRSNDTRRPCASHRYKLKHGCHWYATIVEFSIMVNCLNCKRDRVNWALFTHDKVRLRSNILKVKGFVQMPSEVGWILTEHCLWAVSNLSYASAIALVILSSRRFLNQQDWQSNHVSWKIEK